GTNLPDAIPTIYRLVERGGVCFFRVAMAANVTSDTIKNLGNFLVSVRRWTNLDRWKVEADAILHLSRVRAKYGEHIACLTTTSGAQVLIILRTCHRDELDVLFGLVVLVLHSTRCRVELLHHGLNGRRLDLVFVVSHQ